MTLRQKFTLVASQTPPTSATRVITRASVNAWVAWKISTDTNNIPQPRRITPKTPATPNPGTKNNSNIRAIMPRTKARVASQPDISAKNCIPSPPIKFSTH
ncbi:hypothetical protein [Desulforamulus profundi]|uniref:hypothetical protein n=1 Tax=Desulforamulus profundi TaxID=1383067 RepID=UPI001EE4FE8B|nr:hypothetical protein [Desulforamulus profundi]